jgi:hypothetical protein
MFAGTIRSAAAFLRQYGVIRKRPLQHIDYRRFRFAVGLSDEVDRVALAFNVCMAQAPQMYPAGGACRANGDSFN